MTIKIWLLLLFLLSSTAYAQPIRIKNSNPELLKLENEDFLLYSVSDSTNQLYSFSDGRIFNIVAPFGILKTIVKARGRYVVILNYSGFMAGSYSFYLFALDSDSGNLLWQKEFPHPYYPISVRNEFDFTILEDNSVVFESAGQVGPSGGIYDGAAFGFHIDANGDIIDEQGHAFVSPYWVLGHVNNSPVFLKAFSDFSEKRFDWIIAVMFEYNPWLRFDTELVVGPLSFFPRMLSLGSSIYVTLSSRSESKLLKFNLGDDKFNKIFEIDLAEAIVDKIDANSSNIYLSFGTGYKENGINKIFEFDQNSGAYQRFFDLSGPNFYTDFVVFEDKIILSHTRLDRTNTAFEYVYLDTLSLQEIDKDVKVSKFISNLGTYPNPSNSDTKISFDIINPCNLEVGIYSVKGQLIKKLLNAPVSVGPHQLMWDGKNRNNLKVSSGVYFCYFKMRSEENNESLARRMIFIN